MKAEEMALALQRTACESQVEHGRTKWSQDILTQNECGACLAAALARAHAEGLEAAAREVARGRGPWSRNAAARIRSLIPAAPEVIRPAAEERKSGPDWQCPQCGGGYDAGRGLVCEGETGACHPAASLKAHGTAVQPCEEARCMSCGWAGTLPPPPPAPAPAAGREGEQDG